MALIDEEGVRPLLARLRELVVQRPDTWADLDVTMPQLRVLFAVRRKQPISVSALADTLELRLAAASALVNRLVRAGLLHRSEDPRDRRRVLLALTDSAEQALTRVDERSTARFAAVLTRMSPEGRRHLAAALMELVHLAETSVKGDSRD
ncbi:MAG: MarR family transcriptional regulator [Actinomycetia bacterium]|nr:MarR family transcriptional regulator [Actinomycetes bacterium]